MNNPNQVKIIYYSEPTDLFWVERGAAGFVKLLRVELPGGSQYPVSFYTGASLKSDLEISGFDASDVVKYIAEPGLIIVPEITQVFIESAVNQLYRRGYFDHLRPITGRLLVGDSDLRIDQRTRERYAFNLIVNNYLESKGMRFTDTMTGWHGWSVVSVDGTKMIVLNNTYYVEGVENEMSQFEIDYDPKRGGVIAHKSLPSSLSHGYDILIPNEQIANIEKE